jgi:5-methylcytosine-specific restriction protein A
MPSINLGRKKQRDKTFGKQKAQKVYQNRQWKWMREEKFAMNPVCERCESLGKTSPTEEVHHKQTIEAAPDLAFDWDNLESLCEQCHEIRHKEMK